MESINLSKTYLEKSLDPSLPMEVRIKYTLWHLRNVLRVEAKQLPELESYDFQVLPAYPINEKKDSTS